MSSCRGVPGYPAAARTTATVAPGRVGSRVSARPRALAAAWAVLNHLKDQGPALQATLTKKTAALVQRLKALFAQFGLVSQNDTVERIGQFLRRRNLVARLP